MPPVVSGESVFVAGATGYTGREVVRELGSLRDRGVRCVAHIRPGSAAGDAAAAGFEALGAEVDRTPWESAAMRETLVRLRPTCVMGLLGTTRKRAGAAARRGIDESYETVDYALTVLLLEAARAVEPPPRFLYLSALGAEAPGLNPYMRVRYRVERAVVESGVPYTFVRAPFISGSDRQENRPGERFVSIAGDGALALFGALGAKRMQQRFRSITGPALAHELVKLALEPGNESKTVESDALKRGR